MCCCALIFIMFSDRILAFDVKYQILKTQFTSMKTVAQGCFEKPVFLAKIEKIQNLVFMNHNSYPLFFGL